MNSKIYGYNEQLIPQTGVNPNYKMKFGICINGRKESDKPEEIETTVVKDAESRGLSIDGKIEEWDAMDQDGWGRKLMTAKSISASMGGKRNYGDPGNDYVASKAYAIGQDCNSWFSIIFPNGDQLIIPCVINVTSLGGDATGVESLEWEIKSDGKPTYVEYVAV